MTGPRGAALIMAKAPRPGRVKTRLHPLLGPAGSARLQAELIRRTAALTRGRRLGTFVAFDPPDARAELELLVPDGVRLLPQRGADLGERVAAAAGDVLSGRAGPLPVIGTGAPTLTPALLDRAAAALREPADAVLGPALDGGYYLIGLHRPQPDLFALDPGLWGGDRVLAATLAAAHAAGLTVRLLPRVRDLDTPEDAAALLADPLLPEPIARLLTPMEAA